MFSKIKKRFTCCSASIKDLFKPPSPDELRVKMQIASPEQLKRRFYMFHFISMSHMISFCNLIDIKTNEAIENNKINYFGSLLEWTETANKGYEQSVSYEMLKESFKILTLHMDRLSNGKEAELSYLVHYNANMLYKRRMILKPIKEEMQFIITLLSEESFKNCNIPQVELEIERRLTQDYVVSLTGQMIPTKRFQELKSKSES